MHSENTMLQLSKRVQPLHTFVRITRDRVKLNVGLGLFFLSISVFINVEISMITTFCRNVLFYLQCELSV